MNDQDSNSPQGKESTETAPITPGGQSSSPQGLEDILTRLVDAINRLNMEENQQSESLERLEEKIVEAQEDREVRSRQWRGWLTQFVRDREASWREWLTKMTVRIIALILGISGFWGFMGWYIDRLEIVRMARTYSDTAVQVYQEEENTNVALQLLDKAVDLNGNDSDIRFQRAFIGGMAVVRDLLNLDRPINKTEIDRAHEALAQAHILQRLRPENAEPHILSSQIYTALGKMESAEAEINQALNLAPENPLVRFRHATFLLEKINKAKDTVGDPKELLHEAEQELDKALQYCRKDTEGEELNTSLFSLLTEPFVKKDGASGARLDKMIYNWKGVLESEHRRNFAKAREYYDKALEIDPSFSLALASRGLAWLKDTPKDFSKAAEDFRKALETDPNCLEAYYGLGMTYGFQDRYETARYYFDKGLSIDDSSLRLWQWRGVVNMEMELWDDALKDYEKALELNPAAFDLYIRKAKVLQKTGKPEQAIRDLLFASELSPNNPEIAYNLGNIYLSVDDAERALARYGDALKQKPDYDDCWAAQASALEKAGRQEEALDSLDNAISCTKQKPERFLLLRGDLNHKMGRFNEALQDYQAARSKDENLAPAWFGEARALADLKKTDEALSALERFINLRPDDPEGRQLLETLKNAPQPQ